MNTLVVLSCLADKGSHQKTSLYTLVTCDGPCSYICPLNVWCVPSATRGLSIITITKGSFGDMPLKWMIWTSLLPIEQTTRTAAGNVGQLPGVFSLEASEVSVESRASDLNFFSGTCSVVWCTGALCFLSGKQENHKTGWLEACKTPS